MQTNSQIIFIFLLFSQNVLGQTSISGVINTYAPVTTITGQDITIGTTQGAGHTFAPCDQVLMIQMKGAKVNTTNTAAFGDITALNNAGKYEFAAIAGVSGNVLTLSSALSNAYDVAGGKVQLIHVPHYDNAILTGNLDDYPYNNSTGVGGVLVLEVAGTLDMDTYDIDVSGDGFSGGSVGATNNFCGGTDFDYSSNQYGGKGEGISGTTILGYGKGHYANGGGGGNRVEAGGGGGSNNAAGGFGGRPNSYSFLGSCNDDNKKGIGGLALSSSGYSVGDNRIFLGGGGGSGNGNNSTNLHGGNGGGIVIIKAGTIDGQTGSSPSILANGDNGFGTANTCGDIATGDGAGGGGGGGAILLDIQTYNVAIEALVNGGDGASTLYFGQGNEFLGPGGGGGAGAVWCSGGAVPVSLNVYSDGGISGLARDGNCIASSNNHYAAAGSDGASLAGLVLPGNSMFYVTTSASICPNDSIFLGGAFQNAAGTYYDIYNSANGCDSTIVTTLALNPAYNIAQNASICKDDSIYLGGAYQSEAGNYTDTLVASTGCDSIIVTTLSINPDYNMPQTVGICPYDSIFLGGAYQTNPGTYYDTLSSSEGCDSIIITTLTIHTMLKVSFSSLSNNFCEGANPVSLTGAPVGGIFSGNGVTVNQFDPVLAGVGTHTISYVYTDGNGCIDSTVQQTSVNVLPEVVLGNDTLICYSCSLMLDAGNSGATYLWSTGATTQSILAGAAGFYWVEVRDGNGCAGSDTIIIEREEPDAVNERNFLGDLTISPNPYRGSTQITLNLPLRADVSLAIYDLAGKNVANLSEGELSSGISSYTFSAIKSGLAPGMYLLKLGIKDQVYVYKLMEFD